MIRLLERDQIEDKKWNGCVHFGFNGLPYGYTWYLDVVSEQWKGLVYNEYDAVFPIVWNKKWGIQYMYTPYFTQQLGLYSLNPLSEKLIHEFYEAIPEEIKYIDIRINPYNWKEDKSFALEEKPNYMLDLNKEYDELRSRYSGNARRNLKKSEKAALKIIREMKPETFADFYKQHTAPKLDDFGDKEYFKLTRLIYNAIHFNVGFLTGVVDENENLQAAGFFIFNQNFIINLANTSSQQGRTNGSMTMLIDFLIQINANKPPNSGFRRIFYRISSEILQELRGEENDLLPYQKE